MWETLALIAWSERSNVINQAFTLLLAVVLFSQVARWLRYSASLERWHRIFSQAQLDFEREGSLKIESKGIFNDLLPPNPHTSQLWTNLPSILMMLGLLGTFVGLTLALALIPFGGSAQEIQQGVKEALPSMGSAFWTSLSALLASLVVRVCTLTIEARFKSRVLDMVARADPTLVSQIELQAFLDNRPGALLRPHSLREVMWQQNRESNKHIQEMLGQVASAIRELPLALGGSAPLDLPQVDVSTPVTLQGGERGELSELVGLVREQNELLKALIAQQTTARETPTQGSTQGPTPQHDHTHATMPLSASLISSSHNNEV
jgi:hypothetical protein